MCDHIDYPCCGCGPEEMSEELARELEAALDEQESERCMGDADDEQSDNEGDRRCLGPDFDEIPFDDRSAWEDQYDRGD